MTSTRGNRPRSQGLIVEVDHPTAGLLALPGPPLRFDDMPYVGGRQHHLAPPRLGEHNDSVRAWLDDLHGDTRAFGGTHQVDGSG
jgi:hypothetical protein